MAIITKTTMNPSGYSFSGVGSGSGSGGFGGGFGEVPLFNSSYAADASDLPVP